MGVLVLASLAHVLGCGSAALDWDWGGGGALRAKARVEDLPTRLGLG